MGFVRATAVHTPEYGIVARSAAYQTGSGGTGVVSREMWGGTPPTGGRVGAHVVVVSIAVAVGTLSVGVER